MNSNTNDKSGINCLAGFAFQIRVFACQALLLKENDIVEFETIDDVNVKIHAKNIDDKEDAFRCNVKSEHSNNLIQVKRTKLSQDLFNKTLFNWILQRDTGVDISAFTIFSEHSYQNEDTMFSISAEELYNLAILTTKKKANAIEVRIKKRYSGKFDEFEEAYNDILSKYKFIGDKDINLSIYNTAKRDLRFSEETVALYNDRLTHFMDTIQNNILNAVNKKQSYSFSHKDLIRVFEDLNTGINTENYCPPYYSFKNNLDYVTLSNSDIKDLRETKQLLTCDLAPNRMIERLKQLMYYKHFRYLSVENGKQSKPKSIEETSYNNFQSVLEDIQEQNDTPRTRLLETEKRTNSYAQNEETKWGSCIYLTGENVKNQISWKDNIDDSN